MRKIAIVLWLSATCALLSVSSAVAQSRGLVIPSDIGSRIDVQQEVAGRTMALAAGVGAAPVPNAQCTPHMARFDLRDHGFVTTPRSQGGCGSCWAFSSASAIESSFLYFNKNAIAAPLSEQELLDCSDTIPRPDWQTTVKYDCSGGFFDGPFGYGDQPGTLPEGHYRTGDGSSVYTGVKAQCARGQPGLRTTLFTWSYVRGVSVTNGTPVASTDAIKAALCDYGGVVTTLESAEWPTSFRGPIIVGQKTNMANPWYGPTTGHAVQIVGWDNDYAWRDSARNAGRGVWIIKNSWGPEWGDQGYVRVPYGYQSVGLVAAWARADLRALLTSVPPGAGTKILNGREAIRALQRQDSPGKVIQDLRRLDVR